MNISDIFGIFICSRNTKQISWKFQPSTYNQEISKIKEGPKIKQILDFIS